MAQSRMEYLKTIFSKRELKLLVEAQTRRLFYIQQVMLKVQLWLRLDLQTQGLFLLVLEII